MYTARLFAQLERERAALAGGLAWELPADFLDAVESKSRRPGHSASGAPALQAEEEDHDEDEDFDDTATRAACASLRESLSRRSSAPSDQDLARLRRRVRDEAARCALRLGELRQLLRKLPDPSPAWSDLHFVYLRIQAIVERLVCSHLSLVGRHLQDPTYASRSLDYDDLHQEGVIGLIVGVDKYKFRLGMPFPRYAMRGIFGRVQRALTNDERLIRVPSGTLEAVRRVRFHYEKLERQQGRTPTIIELASGLQMPPRRVADVLEIARVFDSGHLWLDAEADNPRNAGALTTPDPNPEVAAQVHEQQALVDFALSRLDRRARDVLRLRAGLEDDSDGWSLSQIGDAMNLSRERIRQIEGASLERIRQILNELPARVPSPLVSDERLPYARSSEPTPVRAAGRPAQAGPVARPVPALPLGVDPKVRVDLSEASLLAFRDWVHGEKRLKDSTGAMLTSVLRGARRTLGEATTAGEFRRWGAPGSNATTACSHFLAFVLATGRVAASAPPSSPPLGAVGVESDGLLPPEPVRESVPPDAWSSAAAEARPLSDAEQIVMSPDRATHLPDWVERPGGSATPGCPGAVGMLIRGLRPDSGPPPLIVAKPGAPTSEVTRDALRSTVISLVAARDFHLSPLKAVVPLRAPPPVPLLRRVDSSDDRAIVAAATPPPETPSAGDPLTPPKAAVPRVDTALPALAPRSGAASDVRSNLHTLLSKFRRPPVSGRASGLDCGNSSGAHGLPPEVTPWVIRWLASHPGPRSDGRVDAAPPGFEAIPAPANPGPRGRPGPS